MLVITRRPNEAILIEHDIEEIEIIVLGIRGRQVRIGIKAPKEVKVYRKEAQEENEDGSFSTNDMLTIQDI